MSDLDFIVAKVRAMHGKLHERERLRPLCDLPRIEDLAAALAPDVPVGDPIALQRHLTARHIAELHKLLPHLNGWEAEMVLWMLRRYQVENLKVLLRGWAAKTDRSVLAAYTAPVPPDLDLPADELLRAPDLETLIGRVPVPAFRDGALLGLGEFEESGRLFFVEAGIDRAYYAGLRALAERGGASAAPSVMRLVLLEVGLYNVMLVLRAVFNYSILFNKVRLLLAPLDPVVTMDVLEAMRHAPDIDAAALLVPSSLLGRGVTDVSGGTVESALWRNLYRVANRLYYTCVLDFGAVAAFYYIKRVELSNLITISECIRYGEGGAAIRERLVGLPARAPEGTS